MTEKEERSIDAFFQTFFFVRLPLSKKPLVPFYIFKAVNWARLTFAPSFAHSSSHTHSEQQETILAMETVIRRVLAASHLPDNDKKRAINTLLTRNVSTLSKPDASLLLDLGLELKTASVLISFNLLLLLDTLGHLIPISIDSLRLYDT